MVAVAELVGSLAAEIIAALKKKTEPHKSFAPYFHPHFIAWSSTE